MRAYARELYTKFEDFARFSEKARKKEIENKKIQKQDINKKSKNKTEPSIEARFLIVFINFYDFFVKNAIMFIFLILKSKIKKNPISAGAT